MVERLNRSKPPPGHYLDPEHHDRVRQGHGKPRSLAEAWERWESKRDPPGMLVTAGCWFAEGGPGHAPVDGGIGEVRKAAWAHYWRADALAKRLSTGPFAPLTCECSKPPAAWGGRGASVCRHTGEYLRVLSIDFWPALRGAHGSQLDEIDRWLAEGGELPEVLRA